MIQRQTKFVQIYGMTLEQIAHRLGVSPYKAYILHIQNKIKIPKSEKRCPNCKALILK